MVTERAAFVIDRFLLEQSRDLKLIGRAENTWDVLVPSYWKETIAVSLSLHDTHLRGDAFFLRAPEEDRGAAYQLLLRRNERAHVWKFAVNDVGDVSLVCELPIGAIDEDGLDRLLGTLITLVDQTYVPYMKIAFGTALEEQAERGGPGLERPPWAKDWEPPEF